MSDETRFLYDEVPYPSAAFPETHPFRLATIATLYGTSPPPPRRARILELGCGSGGNLIPMAAGLPEAECTGVDLSRSAIAAGTAAAAELGLSNLTLYAADLRDLDGSLGRFDYIIAHGLYSWVPREVQEKLLWLCGHLLSDGGVAYVSYNALPGSGVRRVLRDMLRFHVKKKADPREQVAQARALVQFLADSVPPQEALYRGELQAERERLDGLADAVLFHDDLSAHNEALFLHELVARARAYGLDYLGDAELADMHGHRVARPVLDTLADIADRVVFEQYLDFLTGRAFRRTLLCRADAAPEASPLLARVPQLQVLAAAAPDPASATPAEPSALHTERFRGRDGVVASTADPLTRAALWTLHSEAPRALPFDALYETLCARVPLSVPSEEGVAELVLALATSGLVELCADALPVTLTPGERPRTSALCRAQAARGGVVTSQRHKNVALDDEPARRLVSLLDGTRDRAALCAALAGVVPGSGGPPSSGGLRDPTGRIALSDPPVDPVLAKLERALARLGRLGLLIE
jgi:SAM-dependent methyltransferase